MNWLADELIRRGDALDTAPDTLTALIQESQERARELDRLIERDSERDADMLEQREATR